MKIEEIKKDDSGCINCSNPAKFKAEFGSDERCNFRMYLCHDCLFELGGKIYDIGNMEKG